MSSGSNLCDSADACWFHRTPRRAALAAARCPARSILRSADTWDGKVPETSQTCNHSMPCAAGMAALGGACFFVTPSPQALTDCAVACTSGSVSPIAGMPPWDVLSLFGYTGIATVH